MGTLFNWERLVWTVRAGRRFSIRVYPTGLLALFALFWFCGSCLMYVVAVFTALCGLLTGHVGPQELAAGGPADIRAALAAGWQFVPFALGATITHELGHVAGHHLASPEPVMLVLGSGGSTHGEDITDPRQWVRMIVLGPLASIGYGLILIAAAPLTSWAGLAGLYAIANGVLNLAPIGPASNDGQRLYRHLQSRQVIDRRRRLIN